MDFFTALNERHSYRGLYRAEPVPRADLQRLLEAGLAAPSGCNQQTTSLIAVDDATLLQKFGQMLDKPGFASAPAGICVLTEKKIAYRGRSYYVQDYAAAIENILLAITALGYASCWVEGYITDADAIGDQMAKLLGVPENLHLVAFLPVGKPAAAVSAPAKVAFSERAWFNGFGQK